ncbi:hypothetical protein PIB30_079708, partial [Stylosanthes scabra]|nr:hypothetical protein [Stylosanthes scabra]
NHNTCTQEIFCVIQLLYDHSWISYGKIPAKVRGRWFQKWAEKFTWPKNKGVYIKKSFQYREAVRFETDEAFKHRQVVNKANRVYLKGGYLHTGGSLTIPKTRARMTRSLDRPPIRLELFKETYTRKRDRSEIEEKRADDLLSQPPSSSTLKFSSPNHRHLSPSPSHSPPKVTESTTTTQTAKPHRRPLRPPTPQLRTATFGHQHHLQRHLRRPLLALSLIPISQITIIIIATTSESTTTTEAHHLAVYPHLRNPPPLRATTSKHCRTPPPSLSQKPNTTSASAFVAAGVAPVQRPCSVDHHPPPSCISPPASIITGGMTRNGKTSTKGSVSTAAGSTARNLGQPLLRSCFRKVSKKNSS